MASTFLSEDELERFTGYTQPAKQEKFLKSKRIPCFKNGKGEIVVTTEAVIQVMSPHRPPEASNTPDWNAI